VSGVLERGADTQRVSDEQRDLLGKLDSIAEMIAGHHATVALLERERLQLQTRLRLTGFRGSRKECADG